MEKRKRNPAIAHYKMKGWALNRILLAAAQEGNFEGVKEALKLGAYVNIKGNEGITALHYAANNSNIEIAQLLINANANLNASDAFGTTALHIAALNENAELAKLLVENGADPEIKDNDGKTAFDYGNGKIKESIIETALKERKTAEKEKLR